MLGLKEWLFLQPLFVGDTIRLQLTILDTELGRSGRTGRVGRRFQLFNQNNELVQEGLSDVLVLTKTAPLS
jgi:acyl dehydratase